MISQTESFLSPDKQGTLEEGRRIKRPKRFISTYHNKGKDNSSKNHNENNTHQASFQKIRQIFESCPRSK